MAAEKVIYHADGLTGEYLGSSLADPDPLVEKNWLIPANAFTEKPPEPEPGYAVIRTGATWKKVRDYRGTLYRISDGTPSEHTSLGALPEGFTDIPRPDEDYLWSQGQWQLDEQAQTLREQTEGRVWRDAQIASVQWLRDRHRDESELERDHTLSAEHYKQLLGYLQALRDWPLSERFPGVEGRPQAPDWLAEQT